MKITGVKTVLLTGPCTLDPYLSELRKLRSAALIKIDTDAGVSGIGETYAGYFIPEAVPSIVEFFEPILLGCNVDDIPELWRRMYHCGNFWCRVGLGVVVLAGIEAALWDLKGRLAGTPVYKLLRELEKTTPQSAAQQPPRLRFPEKIPAYATGGPSNYPPEKLLQKIEYYCSLGFQGVKIGAGAYTKEKGVHIPHEPAAAAELEATKAENIRHRFGKDLRLMLDGHMGNSATTWGLETATAVARALEPFDLFFFEEPLHYTRPDLYAALRRQTKTPIAGGECLTAVCEWQAFLALDGFEIGQPDASFTAGLSQCLEVAGMLAARGCRVAPHAWGAGASQMQNVHLGFACPNTAILEVAPAYGPLHSELIGDSLRMLDGFILPPEKPGLGIELSEATIRRFPFVPGTGEFNSVPGKLLTT